MPMHFYVLFALSLCLPTSIVYSGIRNRGGLKSIRRAHQARKMHNANNTLYS